MRGPHKPPQSRLDCWLNKALPACAPGLPSRLCREQGDGLYRPLVYMMWKALDELALMAALVWVVVSGGMVVGWPRAPPGPSSCIRALAWLAGGAVTNQPPLPTAHKGAILWHSCALQGSFVYFCLTILASVANTVGAQERGGVF